jgi:hypothetical protein
MKGICRPGGIAAARKGDWDMSIIYADESKYPKKWTDCYFQMRSGTGADPFAVESCVPVLWTPDFQEIRFI